MDRDDQTAIEMVERLAACTAKHHLILDLHGIYKPVGLNRTYPNILNYESVFGMEECRWTEAKNDMPLYDVTFPYIRMMAGQVDFTPGAMRNGTRDNWKAIYTKPISMGTRCRKLPATSYRTVRLRCSPTPLPTMRLMSHTPDTLLHCL